MLVSVQRVFFLLTAHAQPRLYIDIIIYAFDIGVRMMGKRIGVKFGEGFVTEKVIGIRNFDALVQVTT